MNRTFFFIFPGAIPVFVVDANCAIAVAAGADSIHVAPLLARYGLAFACSIVVTFSPPTIRYRLRFA